MKPYWMILVILIFMGCNNSVARPITIIPPPERFDSIASYVKTKCPDLSEECVKFHIKFEVWERDDKIIRMVYEFLKEKK